MQISDEEILNRLNESWRMALGLDPGAIGLSGERGEITPDTTLRQLAEWSIDRGWFADGFDLDDMLYRWLRDFGIPHRRSRWMDVFGAGFESTDEFHRALRDWPEEFRVQQLTDFLKRQLTDISFEPATICGHTCATAGAFLGVKDVLDRINPNHSGFGPSTPIDDVFDDEMSVWKFWQQLRMFTKDRLPGLEYPSRPRWFSVLCGLGFVVVFGLYVLLLGVLPHASTVEFFCMLGLTVLLSSFLIAQQYLGSVPIYPQGIRTFRDLSEHVSRALHVPPVV